MEHYFSIDEKLRNARLNRVGIVGTTLFLQPVYENSTELWSVDSLYPSTWNQLFKVSFETIFYSFSCHSSNTSNFFFFIVGYEHDSPVIFYTIYRFNSDTREFSKHSITGDRDIPSANADLPLDTLTMRSDGDNVVFFDRSIVMGPIPFWRVEFKEDKFRVIRNDITDIETEEPVRCTRFPIPFNASNRIFGRLKDDSSMIIHHNEKWEEYEMINKEGFELPPTTVRGIQETYGRNGHRLGAVESPLTFHVDGDVCFARIVKEDRHYFYKVTLDHKLKQFIVSQRGNVKLQYGVDKMFYTLCTDEIFAFIGIRKIAVIPIRLPRLEDASTWRIQKHFIENGSSPEGLDKEQMKKLCRDFFERTNISKEL